MTLSRRRSDCKVSMVSSSLPEAKFEETEADVKMLDDTTAT